MRHDVAGSRNTLTYCKMFIAVARATACNFIITLVGVLYLDLNTHTHTHTHTLFRANLITVPFSFSFCVCVFVCARARALGKYKES